MKYKYFNKKVVPPELLFEVVANDILEADKLLEEKTKYNPLKNPWIGCQIEK